jgi:hypothetical protein
VSQARQEPEEQTAPVREAEQAGGSFEEEDADFVPNARPAAASGENGSFALASNNH